MKLNINKKKNFTLKFLNPYTKGESDFFFGRDKEIDRLYNLVNQNRAVLLIGQTGTGKTSVVQCGLSARYKSADWIDFFIRRNNDYVASAIAALRTKAIEELPENCSLTDAVNLIFTQTMRPVYLIFDQFEEIFIGGSEDERANFVKNFNELYKNAKACKIIIVMREEYLAKLYQFEDEAPEIFENVLRIDLMRKRNALEVVKKTLFALQESYQEGKFEILDTPISDEKGNEQSSIANSIVDITKGDSYAVQLPYLQVFLKKIMDTAKDKTNNNITISKELIETFGDIKNVLLSFLDEKIDELVNAFNTNLLENKNLDNKIIEITSKEVWKFLKIFVSKEKTKLQISENYAIKSADLFQFEAEKVRFSINFFATAFIFRNLENNTFELAHDALAAQIADLGSLRARGKNDKPRFSDNPYKGLMSYDAADSLKFFGREKPARELHQKILDNRFVVVVGNSGVGKSSLLKAGVLPRLEKQHFFIVPTFRPQDHALRKLTEAINIAKSSESEKIVIVIDQFEELITRTSAYDRVLFLSQLKSILDDAQNKIYLVATIRADFEPQFQNTELKDFWTKGRFIVPPFSEADIKEIIEEPAWLAGLEFEPHELVDMIASEVVNSSNTLPLLSFTLYELCEKYFESQKNDGKLHRQLYDELGGVLGGLQKRANILYDDLSKKSDFYAQDIRQIMLRMVAINAEEFAGRKVYAEALIFPKEEKNIRVQNIINTMVEERLLVRGRDKNEKEYIEPAHDVLVRRWEKIAVWANETNDADSHRLLDRLYNATKDYNNEADADKKEQLLWDESIYLDVLKSVYARENSWLNVEETHFVVLSLAKRKEEIDAEEQEKKDKIEAEVKQKQKEEDIRHELEHQQKEEKLKLEMLQKDKERTEMEKRDLQKRNRIVVMFSAFIFVVLLVTLYWFVETQNQKNNAEMDRIVADEAKLIATEKTKVATEALIKVRQTEIRVLQDDSTNFEANDAPELAKEAHRKIDSIYKEIQTLKHQ